MNSLSQLCHVMQNQVAPHFGKILPELEKISNDNSSYELNLDTLIILRRLLKTQDSFTLQCYQQYYQNINQIILRLLQHEYSKVVSEALRVAGIFVNVIKGANGLAESKYAGVIQPLYAAIRQKLQTADIDQEIKQCSIIAMANFISICHLNL